MKRNRISNVQPTNLNLTHKSIKNKISYLVLFSGTMSNAVSTYNIWRRQQKNEHAWGIFGILNDR